MSVATHPQEPTEAAMRPHIIRGSIWMVTMRWSIRGIGLVSTIILARLLAPEDFGLVAMALLIVGLIEIFGETGQQLALIRMPNPTREHFDSAWTAQILVYMGLGIVILLAAPLGALYFGEPRVAPVMQVLSIRAFAAAFENIGVVRFIKDLDFAGDFRYGVYKKIISFAIGISLALVLRNHWALVWGIVLGQIGTVVLSYVVHPYRPRLCIRKIPEIWSCSIWMLVGGIGGFLHRRADQYLMGTLGRPQILGLYTVGADLAYLPSAELIFPMSRALIPSYAKLGNDRKQLAGAYLNVLSVVTILAAPTATGLALVSEDVVQLLLGSQWTESATIVFWLALAAGVQACSDSVMSILQAVAEPRRVAIQSWVRVAVIVPVLLGAAELGGIDAVAPARLAGTLLVVPTFFFNLRAAIPITVGQIVRVTWRPMIAAAIMAAAVAELSAALPKWSAVARLAFEVPAGALLFAGSLYLLWLLAGRPSGAESAGLRYLGGWLGWIDSVVRKPRRA